MINKNKYYLGGIDGKEVLPFNSIGDFLRFIKGKKNQSTEKEIASNKIPTSADYFADYYVKTWFLGEDVGGNFFTTYVWQRPNGRVDDKENPYKIVETQSCKTYADAWKWHYELLDKYTKIYEQKTEEKRHNERVAHFQENIKKYKGLKYNDAKPVGNIGRLLGYVEYHTEPEYDDGDNYGGRYQIVDETWGALFFIKVGKSVFAFDTFHYEGSGDDGAYYGGVISDYLLGVKGTLPKLIEPKTKVNVSIKENGELVTSLYYDGEELYDQTDIKVVETTEGEAIITSRNSGDQYDNYGSTEINTNLFKKEHTDKHPEERWFGNGGNMQGFNYEIGGL